MPATNEQCRAYRQRLRRRAVLTVAGLYATCFRCDGDEQLEFAHKYPTGLRGAGRGLTRRMLDVLRNPHCYWLLCRTCHKHYDRKPFCEDANAGK